MMNGHKSKFDDVQVVRWLCRGYGREDIRYIDKEGFEDNNHLVLQTKGTPGRVRYNVSCIFLALLVSEGFGISFTNCV